MSAQTVVVNNSRPLLSIGTVLTVIFVIAKIAGYITWPWWLVLIPLWGPIALVLGIWLLFLIGALLFMGICGAVAGITALFNR